MNFRRLFIFIVLAFTVVGCDTRSAMTRSFLEALLFEYAFWDYGYNGDTKDYSYVYRLEEWL